MTIKQAFSRANPNSMADLLRQVDIGQILGCGLPVYRRRFNFNTAAASSYQQATLQTMALGDAPAAALLRATAIAGGVTGELTMDAYGTTPGSGHIAVAPNGDIVALAADALTSVDVLYVPEKVKVVEISNLPCASSVCTLPASMAGAVLLLEAEGLTGTTPGKKKVLVPGGTNPSAGSARLSVDRLTVSFTTAEAVATCRIKVGIVTPVDLFALMQAAESTV